MKTAYTFTSQVGVWHDVAKGTMEFMVREGSVKEIQIADEVKERLVAHEVAAAEDGVAVAARGGLGDETHP